MHAGAGNDYQKDLQFRKLNEKKDQLEVKMRRGGSQILVPNQQIVVGDVMILQTGDKITADGIVIESNNMVVDEASLTGESEPIKKGSKDMFCRAGTTVSCRADQLACMFVTASASLSWQSSIAKSERQALALYSALQISPQISRSFHIVLSSWQHFIASPVPVLSASSSLHLW